MYSPKKIVDSGLCIGCGICVAYSRRSDTRMQFDAYGQLKPFGKNEWYKKISHDFSSVCPFSPLSKNEDELSGDLFPSADKVHTATGRFLTAWVGYAQEKNYRPVGSSGGMVTWVATELLKRQLADGIVHVVSTENPEKEGRFFKYRISKNEHEVSEGAKSRYYPVELSEVLQMIRETPGRYAVVAIPCMIKAIHLLRQNDPLFHDRIRFTLGLFCGHMKSARFVESFAWQMNIPLNKVKKVDFRYKIPDRPANWYHARLTLNDGKTAGKDWWHLVDGDWGAGFFMNSACNFCDDVVAETADISFGDAWVEPYSHDGKGTNVVIVRSTQLRDLVTEGILNGRLRLDEVSAEFVARTQAAGLRQRREGLAYRLTRATSHIQPLKRVSPDDRHLSKRRKWIYRIRFRISRQSHYIFRVARAFKMPFVYLFWARVLLSVYHGMVYYKGSITEIRKRFSGLKKENVS